MNLFTTVLYGATVLATALSILLILIVCGLHLFADRHARREADFREIAGPVMKGYLVGSVRIEDVIAELKKDPSNALKLLIEFSETVRTQGDDRLHAVFLAFPFVQQELAALKSKHSSTRLKGAQLLGYLRDESVIPSLLEALHDDTLAVRLAAAQSLAKLGCSDAVKPILLALDAPGEMPQRRVAEVLFDLGPRAIDPILDLLNNPEISDTELAIAIRVSGMLHANSAITRLLELLQHENMSIRLNSVRALESIGAPSTIAPLSRLVEDSAWEVRSKVMHALGSMRAVDHIPILVQGLTDSKWWVRYFAAQALYQLGDVGIEQLKNAAEHHAKRYAQDISRQVLQEQGIHHATPEILL